MYKVKGMFLCLVSKELDSHGHIVCLRNRPIRGKGKQDCVGGEMDLCCVITEDPASFTETFTAGMTFPRFLIMKGWVISLFFHICVGSPQGEVSV